MNKPLCKVVTQITTNDCCETETVLSVFKYEHDAKVAAEEELQKRHPSTPRQCFDWSEEYGYKVLKLGNTNNHQYRFEVKEFNIQ